MRDPYKILGVASTAKQAEIKSAFRKLAKKYHPDHNPSDKTAQDKFSQINQAYEIIGDSEKRAQFDRGEIDGEGKPVFQGFGGGDGFGAAHGSRAGFSGFSGGNPFGGGGRSTGGFDPSDLFGDIFGSGQRGGFSGFKPRAPAKGADIKAHLHITLEQMVGADNVEAIFPNGKKLKIKLPAFVQDGQIIRLKGQGEKAGASTPGDAIVTIFVKKHPQLRVEGRALHLDLAVELKDAVLGAKVAATTLEGKVSLTIPPWSSSDKVLRLKAKGLPLKDGTRDDLFVHVRIMLPEPKDTNLVEFFSQ